MSSRRTTRAGIRRLSKAGTSSSGANSGNDANASGKGGTRQLSLPQMLLRHTERLSIESKSPVSNKDETNKSRKSQNYESQNNNNNNGDSNNRNLTDSKNNGSSSSRDPPSTSCLDLATTDSDFGVPTTASEDASSRRSSCRRKRRASDSDPEERESLAGVKRRQTLAPNTGWIPLAPKQEIVWYKCCFDCCCYI